MKKLIRHVPQLIVGIDPVKMTVKQRAGNIFRHEQQLAKALQFGDESDVKMIQDRIDLLKKLNDDESIR